MINVGIWKEIKTLATVNMLSCWVSLLSHSWGARVKGRVTPMREKLRFYDNYLISIWRIKVKVETPTWKFKLKALCPFNLGDNCQARWILPLSYRKQVTITLFKKGSSLVRTFQSLLLVMLLSYPKQIFKWLIDFFLVQQYYLWW